MAKTYKQVECDPTCGFLVRTHEDPGLVRIVTAHGKEFHGLNLTAQDVLAGARVVGLPAR